VDSWAQGNGLDRVARVPSGRGSLGGLAKISSFIVDRRAIAAMMNKANFIGYGDIIRHV